MKLVAARGWWCIGPHADWPRSGWTARLPLVAHGTRLSNTSRAATAAAKEARRRLSMTVRRRDAPTD